MLPDLGTLDATAQAELIRRREATPRDLVEAAIKRIERINPRLNAVIATCFERALGSADANLPDTPFRGVPFLMKDLDGPLAGEQYHCGMNFLKRIRYVADHDSFIARKLMDAGFIPLGKTNTPELGLTVTTEPDAYGPTRNPWNTEHSAGGSSGGSAAAVASGMVPIAHAGDGGGSIRVPASECGLVGLKPSRGRVSLGPDYGQYWEGYVAAHVVTRTVRDCAAILDCVHGQMPGDPYVAPPPVRAYRGELGAPCRGLRIGLMTGLPGGGKPHAECIQAVERAGKGLERAGHNVEISYPRALDEAEEATRAFMNIVSAWVTAALDEWSETVGEPITSADVEPSTWALAELGRTIAARDYIDATKWVGTYTRQVAAWWAGGFDVLVTPTLASPPPKIGELKAPPGQPLGNLDKLFAFIAYTPPFNMTGQPAISLPLHWSADSLPIGVQLVCAYGREDLLLRVASQLEEILPWRQRRALVHG